MFEMELERFRAEAGCGIAELKFMPPRVYTSFGMFNASEVGRTYLSWPAHAEKTCILRHFENWSSERVALAPAIADDSGSQLRWS